MNIIVLNVFMRVFLRCNYYIIFTYKYFDLYIYIYICIFICTHGDYVCICVCINPFAFLYFFFDIYFHPSCASCVILLTLLIVFKTIKYGALTALSWGSAVCFEHVLCISMYIYVWVYSLLFRRYIHPQT